MRVLPVVLEPVGCGPPPVFGVAGPQAAPNDADRLRKYLARFGLDRDVLRGG